MNEKIREILISKILDVDLDNLRLENILIDGFEGYSNLDDVRLIKIFIEYYGIEDLETTLNYFVTNVDVIEEDVCFDEYNIGYLYLFINEIGSDENSKVVDFACIVNLNENSFDWCVIEDGYISDGSFLNMLNEFTSNDIGRLATIKEVEKRGIPFKKDNWHLYFEDYKEVFKYIRGEIDTSRLNDLIDSIMEITKEDMEKSNSKNVMEHMILTNGVEVYGSDYGKLINTKYGFLFLHDEK